MQPIPGKVMLYTDDDVATAKALAEEFKEALLEDMKLLDMIDSF
jgi:hypothetical protein